MSGADTRGDLVFRIPLRWSVRAVVAALVVAVLTVVVAVDAVGIAIMTNLGQHISAEAVGPLEGFSLLLLLWVATVLVLLRVRRRKP